MEWVTDMAAKRAEISPGRIAFKDHATGAELTFAEVNACATRLASRFAAQGFSRRDRIAVLCHNRPEFFILLFAAQKAGMILVPLNWRQPAAELEPILQDSGARLLIYDEIYAATAFALERSGLRIAGMESEMRRWMETAADIPSSGQQVRASDPWYLLYTSGTTGLPKAVIQTPSMAWANAINYSQAVDLVSSDKALNFLPLFHTAGINLFTLPLFLAGGTSTILRKFDEEAVLDLINAREVTAFFGVPAIYQALALNRRFAAVDFSAIRSLGCGGAPISEALLETYQERGLTICNGMGMTETGPTVFLMDKESAAGKIGSVGKAQILADVRLVGLDDAVVDGEGEGELQIRGPGVTPGYFENSEATSAAFADGGWLRTGDVARRDADGYFYIVDRIKDMYISGGENVYPAEVERVLTAHDAVLEAVVIGVSDEKWGEVGAAYLIAKPNRSIDVDALARWCRERLAAYKVPKSFHVTTELPRTAAGKVQKHILKKAYSQAAKEISQ
ncbi:AMP-binding protein [Stappia sp. F7233]|uniref:3-methylmercaptopropionyl-CoA ligase n=1 Tax=Stappia albiluteola TaxID=2758565 RepID=A0A839ABF1_9HYPH|nr:AMP-binding protein [Stappia albiluteola]MBA5776751.1 AMP-binding protein [Stappia albiluteola]